MESQQEAREIIHRELISDDAEVRAEFIKLFEADVNRFADVMSRAVLGWRAIDAMVLGDERRSYVSALVYAAFTLHIISFKLFLSGHMVAAGNQFRQVVETIALALLCSGKDLDVLEKFMEDKYSTNDAVRDVLRHASKLALKADGLQALKSAQGFYHKYSHVTRLTLATTISSSENGSYVGASFDKGRLDAYRREVQGRLGLAQVFPNFVAAVKSNLAQW
jgi:hypothetical protein